MLRFLRVYRVEGINNDDYYNSILNKIEQKNDLFSWNGDEVIVFKEKDTDEVLKYLDIKSYDFEDTGELLTLFHDSDEYMKVGILKMYKNECATELGNIIDNGIYDDRIVQSEHCYKEIEQIIKEQAIKIYEEKINQINIELELIKHGDFKWI